MFVETEGCIAFYMILSSSFSTFPLSFSVEKGICPAKVPP